MSNAESPSPSTLLFAAPLVESSTFNRCLGAAITIVALCIVSLPAAIPSDSGAAVQLFRAATTIPAIASLVEESLFPFATAVTYLLAIILGIACAALLCVSAIDQASIATSKRNLRLFPRAIAFCVAVAALWLPFGSDDVPDRASRLYQVHVLITQHRAGFGAFAVGVLLVYAVSIPWIASELALAGRRITRSR